jgi:hypothetical protein
MRRFVRRSATVGDFGFRFSTPTLPQGPRALRLMPSITVYSGQLLLPCGAPAHSSICNHSLSYSLIQTGFCWETGQPHRVLSMDNMVGCYWILPACWFTIRQKHGDTKAVYWVYAESPLDKIIFMFYKQTWFVWIYLYCLLTNSLDWSQN